MTSNIIIAKTLDEVENIRPAWEKLQTHPNADIDFYNMIVKIRNKIIKPYVMLYTNDDKKQCMLVGRMETSKLSMGIGYKVLFNIDVKALIIIYGGIVGDISDEIAEKLIDELMTFLRNSEFDVIILSGVQTQSSIFKKARTVPYWFCRDHTTRTRRHYQIKLTHGFKEYIKPNKSIRKKMRQFNNKMSGRYHIKKFNNQNSVIEFCSDAEKIAKKTYQRGLGVGFHHNDDWERRLLFEARKNHFRGYILYIDNNPIAFDLSTLYGSVCYLDCAAYDPDYSKGSVGQILLMKVIEDLFSNEGIITFDFGIGEAEYKERFSNNYFEESDVLIWPITASGVGLNLLKTSIGIISNTMEFLITKTKLRNRIKKIWRHRIAKRLSHKQVSV